MKEAKHTPGPWRISDENPKIIKEDMSMIGSSRVVLIASACGLHDSGFYPSDHEATRKKMKPAQYTKAQRWRAYYE